MLDQRCMHIVHNGTQKPVSYGNRDNWAKSIKSIMAAVKAQLSGEITWVKKRPVLNFTYRNGTFKFYVAESYGYPSLYLEWKVGRSESYKYLKTNQIEAMTVEDCAKEFIAYAAQIGRRNNGLMFEPLTSESVMKSVLQDQIASVPLTWDVEIENDNSHPELNSINVSGDTERKVDGNAIILRTSMRSHINETGLPFLTVLLNGKSLVTCSSYGGEFTEDTAEAALDKMAKDFKEGYETITKWHGPKSDSWRYERFYYQDEFDAFKGWFILNCGVSLGGRIEQAFADEIKAYNAYDDKNSLHKQIKQKIKKD